MKKSSFYFWTHFLLGGTGLLFLIAALWNASPFAVIGIHAFLGHIRDFCEKIGERNEIILYGITVGFSFFVFVLLGTLAKTAFYFLKARSIWSKIAEDEIKDKKIMRAAERAGLKISDVRITSDGYTPFCAGFLRPKILISNEFSEKLNTRELTAVLLHEKQHLKSFDVLKTLAIRFFCSLLFFLPVVKILAQKYYLSSELEADARASANFRFRGPLLSVMSKIHAGQYFFAATPGIATAINMRMGFLLSLENFPQIKITKKQALASIAFFAILAAIFFASFHLNHALSIEVVKFQDGQMTPVKWNDVSFFDSLNLYLTPINQTLNATQCAGRAVNFSHL